VTGLFGTDGIRIAALADGLAGVMRARIGAG
jgi:hypothetical protein